MVSGDNFLINFPSTPTLRPIRLGSLRRTHWRIPQNIKIQMSYEVPGSRATVYGYLAVTQNISL